MDRLPHSKTQNLVSRAAAREASVSLFLFLSLKGEDGTKIQNILNEQDQ